MEKYIVYYDENPTSKEYIATIYRNSRSTTSDIGSAIEFTDKDTALKIREYLNEREGNTKYKVMCIKTTFEEEVE